MPAMFFALAVLFFAGCAQATTATMKASFHLQHDQQTGVVSVHPDVYADRTERVDYKIKAGKQGKAGTSNEINRGHLDLNAGKTTIIGPLLSFGSFAPEDKLKLELLLCRLGSRCKHDDDVIARFTSSYPDDNSGN
ncbi:MAG: hypothetical protein R8K53_06120 [Mariprofundaceae bacterium]